MFEAHGAIVLKPSNLKVLYNLATTNYAIIGMLYIYHILDLKVETKMQKPISF